MARTCRRQRERHEYSWVLRSWKFGLPRGASGGLDPTSAAGRKAIALFHADGTSGMSGTASRWFRKVSDHRIRTVNDRSLRRWISDPGFDPVFQDWHKHEANWNWW